MKPTDDTCKVTLPAGAAREKDPSWAVDVPPVLPFTVTDAPARPTLSLAETTLPVIVRFCANTNVPKNNKGIVSKQVRLDISRVFYFKAKKLKLVAEIHSVICEHAD